MDVHQNLKIELPCDSAVPLLYIFKGNKTYLGAVYIPAFTAALFVIVKTYK